MPTYLNPERYTEKVAVFPPFVEEVDSALPAFVGYTEKAERRITDDLILQPFKVSSFKEFEHFYGKAHCQDLAFEVGKDRWGRFILLNYKDPPPNYLLHHSVRLYFENGGTPCYILSVDTYQNPPLISRTKAEGSGKHGLQDGLDKLSEVADLSIIVIPETVRLPVKDYRSMVQATLEQCGTMGNRFAIFDLFDGDKATPDLALNRSYLGSGYLHYGSAYYPFLKSKINFKANEAESNVRITFNGEIHILGSVKKTNPLLRNFILNQLKKSSIVIPSSGIVAGVYTFTDRNRGVWKSPANLNLIGVREPIADLDNQGQELLTKDPEDGKSINAIRSFANKGVQMCSSRTFSGKHNEWRYVPVCRFFMMLKESLRRSTSWVILEPNEPKTWMKVVAMIEHYLTLKWKEGALAGVSQQMAFYVKCGLGSTMTEQDVRDGVILIEVGLAILRPGEFIVLKLSHIQKR